MSKQAMICTQRGSTLIEAMVAMAILTIGILAVMAMQVNAIGASSSAMNRTEANNAALSLMETLKQLPMNDPTLDPTGAAPGSLEAADARVFTAASLTDVKLDKLLSIPAAAAPGFVMDNSGLVYRLSWAVRDRVEGTKTLNKTIRVFMDWNTTAGRNRLEMTTTTYSD